MLIQEETQLRRLLPNAIKAVQGEKPLLEKLASFLETAEQWVAHTFTSEDIFLSICNETTSPYLRLAAEQLVATDALLRALPALDLVLTPNGFAVVSTQNLTPASKPRTDRLVASLQAERDRCIDALLHELRRLPEWHTSFQAQFFSATLFPTVKCIDAMPECYHKSSRWDAYLALRPRLIDLEDSLAEDYLSHELLAMLRLANLTHALTEPQRTVLIRTQAQILHYLAHDTFNGRALAQIVNYIRSRPDAFPEWQDSPTAQLFSPPTFQNDKHASGYFF